MKFDKSRFNDEYKTVPEPMAEFFNKRAGTYENHMMTNVDGTDEFYGIVAENIPVIDGLRLLDIGCGTGLEIDEIVKLNETVSITGIDGSAGMLGILESKYADRPGILKLENADFMKAEFGENHYDAAVSVMALHHFSHKEKTGLYMKIHKSLKQGGVYVECDYMAPDQEYEDFYFHMLGKIKDEQGLGEGYFHFDTPCTVRNQKKMLVGAGFDTVEVIWEKGCSVVMKACKIK